MLPLAVALLVAPADPVEIHWDAPEGCPDGPEVQRRIVDEADPTTRTGTLVVTGTIRRLASGRFELTLRIVKDDDPPDLRRFEDDTCEAVTAAATVVVALRWVGAPIEEEATPIDEPPEPPADEPGPSVPPPAPVPVAPAPVPVAPALEASPEPPPDPLPPRDAPPPPRPAPPRDRSDVTLGGWLSLAGGLSIGILPGVGGIARVAGGIAGTHWRVGALVQGRPVRTTPHPARTDVTGRFDLVTGGVLGCGVPRAGRFSFPLCGRVEAGGLRGVGQGAVTDPRPGFSPWIGLGIGAAAAWRPLRWLAPFFALDGTVGLATPRFTVGGIPGTIYETRRLGLCALAGIEFTFGPQKPAATETHP